MSFAERGGVLDRGREVLQEHRQRPPYPQVPPGGGIPNEAVRNGKLIVGLDGGFGGEARDLPALKPNAPDFQFWAVLEERNLGGGLDANRTLPSVAKHHEELILGLWVSVKLIRKPNNREARD